MSITSMITDRTEQHEVTITFFEKKKPIHLGQTSPVETMSKEKNSPDSFFRISDCSYGYCDQFCDWWI